MLGEEGKTEKENGEIFRKGKKLTFGGGKRGKYLLGRTNRQKDVVKIELEFWTQNSQLGKKIKVYRFALTALHGTKI